VHSPSMFLLFLEDTSTKKFDPRRRILMATSE
jgi:hypothetical protein